MKRKEESSKDAILYLTCVLAGFVFMIFMISTLFDSMAKETRENVNVVTLVNGTNVVCYKTRGFADNVYTDCTDGREHVVGISDSIDARRLNK